MPLYRYICEDCKQVFEELVFGDAKPPCPKCGSGAVRRHYQGKCYFGMSGKTSEGTSSGKSCSCGGSCGTCGGCH